MTPWQTFWVLQGSVFLSSATLFHPVHVGGVIRNKCAGGNIIFTTVEASGLTKPDIATLCLAASEGERLRSAV